MAKPSTYWDKRAIKRLTDAEKQSEEYIKRIQKIYDRANRNIQREIDTIYKNYAKDTGLNVQSLKTLLTKSETAKLWDELRAKGLDKYVKGNYKARISRLEKLQAQIYAKAKEIYPAEQLEQTMCYRGVINDSYYKAIYDTQMGTGLDFAFSNLDENMVTALLNERWSGKNYSQRIWGNTDILAESLSEVIGGAMISGQSIQKTTRQIRERFNVGKYYAERLVRTEVNHFNNEADAMAYEEMDVDKYVFLATLDTRTSSICQNLDNKVFELKNRRVGENYPPMHPNCRSKTRAYMGEEIEKTLKRRARNPITNENEIIDNMSYKEWAKKHGIDKPKTATPKTDTLKKQPKDAIIKKKANKPRNNIVLNADNFPAPMRANKKELESTKILCDYINSQTNADPKVVKVYGLSGKITNGNMPYKVTHGEKHRLVYDLYYDGHIDNVRLSVPKLTDKTELGKITTILHENGHLIDFMAGNGTNKRYISLGNNNLTNAVRNADDKIGDKVKALFSDYNSGCKDITKRVCDKYSTLFNELNGDTSIGWKEYDKRWKALTKARNLEIDELERNYMGGGVGSLQDIYDALSGGMYRDNGTVTFGHGSKYYLFSNDARVKEIVANYSALSITRPDLIELLRADKPELVNALDEFMDEIITKYGG